MVIFVLEVAMNSGNNYNHVSWKSQALTFSCLKKRNGCFCPDGCSLYFCQNTSSIIIAWPDSRSTIVRAEATCMESRAGTAPMALFLWPALQLYFRSFFSVEALLLARVCLSDSKMKITDTRTKSFFMTKHEALRHKMCSGPPRQISGTSGLGQTEPSMFSFRCKKTGNPQQVRNTSAECQMQWRQKLYPRPATHNHGDSKTSTNFALEILKSTCFEETGMFLVSSELCTQPSVAVYLSAKQKEETRSSAETSSPPKVTSKWLFLCYKHWSLKSKLIQQCLLAIVIFPREGGVMFSKFSKKQFLFSNLSSTVFLSI